MRTVIFLLSFVFACSAEDFYSFSAKTIGGDDFAFEELRGSVSLVVNVASECGYTDAHYKALPKLQEALSKHKFHVLAFPSNDFGAQEPGNSFEILEKVTSKYYINFKLFEKGAVLGEDAQPPFKWLAEQSRAPDWNFWKWLINADGQPIQAWGPQYSVDDIFDDVWRAVSVNEPGGEPKSTLGDEGWAPSDEL